MILVAGGQILRDFIKYGARPENLYGIDLLPDRIEEARRVSPNIDFRYGNAEELPYEEEFFDIVIQFTVFTSILDMNMKKKVAGEMLRVLKPSGSILWYDYHMNNPKNPTHYPRPTPDQSNRPLLVACLLFA